MLYQLIPAKLHASWFHQRTRLKNLLIYLVTWIRSLEWRRTFLKISIEGAGVPIVWNFHFHAPKNFSRSSRFSFVSCRLHTIFEITFSSDLNVSHENWKSMECHLFGNLWSPWISVPIDLRPCIKMKWDRGELILEEAPRKGDFVYSGPNNPLGQDR